MEQIHTCPANWVDIPSRFSPATKQVMKEEVPTINAREIKHVGNSYTCYTIMVYTMHPPTKDISTICEKLCKKPKVFFTCYTYLRL